MTHPATDRPSPTRPPTRAVVPVLAFARAVLSVMQTMLVPVIKACPNRWKPPPATPPGS